MKKISAILIVFLIAIAMVFAQGGKASTSDDGKIHLKAYMQIDPTLSQYAGHNAIMKAFAEKYPNIVIEPEYASGEAFHQKFQAMAASKEIPDIFTCYGGSRSDYM